MYKRWLISCIDLAVDRILHCPTVRDSFFAKLQKELHRHTSRTSWSRWRASPRRSKHLLVILTFQYPLQQSILSTPSSDMAIKVPSTPPSSRLHRRALPLLISKLNDPSIHSSPSELLDLLQSTLQILSHAQLNPPKSGSPLLSSTIPLEALLHLSLLSPSSISLPPLVSAIIAYPNHPDTISTIISSALKSQPTLLDAIRTEIVPNLVTRLRLSPSPPIVRVLHLLLRSHEEILGVLLSEADYILPALHDSYTRLTSIRAKSDALLVCHALVQAVQGGQSGEALKRLMRDSGSSSGRKVLVDTGLSEDYEAIFGGKEGIEDGELGVLRRMRDEEVASDPACLCVTQQEFRS